MAAISVEPCTFALFGALGDLALRKLFPALYQLDRANLLHPDTRLLALARESGSAQEHLHTIEAHLRRHVADADIEPAALGRFLGRLSYQHLDFLQPEGYQALAEQLPGELPLIAYFATAAAVYGAICENLDRAGLAARTRVVLEKPIGHDLESSRRVNDAVARFFPESRVYRIDHYLGKETVQNLMALRFANALLEPVWRNSQVEHVQISVCETLGVENRGGYYDRAGATRDMLQNHLLQLLCLVAMEPPAQFEAEAVRDEKVKILRALKPICGQDVQDKTVRGQYGAGHIGGQEVPAYYFEKDVDNDSDTETFVAVHAHVDNWRWAGVPFYLRTGKRMARRSSQIVIQFKPVPHELFNGGQVNQLLIQLQPQERISLRMMTKSPGKGMRLEPVDLDLNLAQVFGQTRRWEAYERLLLDVLEGDSTLFMRRDEVEAAWAWIDPIIKGWEEHFQAPRHYAAGSNGPEQANSLLARHGSHWHG